MCKDGSFIQKFIFSKDIQLRYKAEFRIKVCVLEWIVVMLLQGLSSFDLKKRQDLEESRVLDKRRYGCLFKDI